MMCWRFHEMYLWLGVRNFILVNNLNDVLVHLLHEASLVIPPRSKRRLTLIIFISVYISSYYQLFKNQIPEFVVYTYFFKVL